MTLDSAPHRQRPTGAALHPMVPRDKLLVLAPAPTLSERCKLVIKSWLALCEHLHSIIKEQILEMQKPPSEMIFQHIHKLSKGTFDWMGIYI